LTSTTFWIQFLGVIFGFLMIYFTFVKLKRRELKKLEFFIWVLGWLLLIFVAVVPSILDIIIAPLNFYRRLDFFVVFGFFILLGLSFYNYSVVKKLERKLVFFIRKEAIEAQKDNKNLK
jgi:hypothetical protein